MSYMSSEDERRESGKCSHRGPSCEGLKRCGIEVGGYPERALEATSSKGDGSVLRIVTGARRGCRWEEIRRDAREMRASGDAGQRFQRKLDSHFRRRWTLSSEEIWTGLRARDCQAGSRPVVEGGRLFRRKPEVLPPCRHQGLPGRSIALRGFHFAPQRDAPAAATSTPFSSGGMTPSSTRLSTVRATHETYLPWFVHGTDWPLGPVHGQS